MSIDPVANNRMNTRGGILSTQSLQLAPTGFPHVLYNILDTEEQSIITWTSSGQAFGIQDMSAFRTQVLPKHFKHDKFSSFQRQLNLYGFRKIVRGREAGGYMHRDFQRGRLDLLKNVRRGVMPPCPEKYERKIYGSGGRAEDSSDSDPELTAPPRGATTAASYVANLLPTPANSTGSNVSMAMSTNTPDSMRTVETMSLDAAAEQLRRLSATRMPIFVPLVTSHIDSNSMNGIGQCKEEYFRGTLETLGTDMIGQGGVPVSAWPGSVKQESSEVDMHVASRRKSSINGMKKLFPRARSNSKLPAIDSVLETTRNVPPVSQSLAAPIYRQEFNNIPLLRNHFSLDNPRQVRDTTPLSPPLVTSVPSKRSSFCAMVASLEQQLQEQGNRTPVGMPTHAIFSQPSFTAQMREFANELQNSACGFDAKQGLGDRGSPLAGLELLHTTAVRRRSSLTELCAAAQRRGSLTDLMQGIIPNQGEIRGKVAGKKRSRSNMESENTGCVPTLPGHQSTNYEGMLGASLRPSILSAFSNLKNNQEDRTGFIAPSNSISQPIQMHDWMDGYYLDDAVRDLEKDDDAYEEGKNFPNISQSKLRASVYVLLSVLSTADGEMAAAGGSNNAAVMSPLRTYSPPSGVHRGSIDLINSSNGYTFFPRNDGGGRETEEKW